jgi:hypothetical protein
MKKFIGGKYVTVDAQGEPVAVSTPIEAPADVPADVPEAPAEPEAPADVPSAKKKKKSAR